MDNKQKKIVQFFRYCIILAALVIMHNANGQDWKWINPTLSGNQLNAVKYLNSNAIIAVGKLGTILLSNNNGKDWKQIISPTKANLLSISAINNDTIFVSGHDLSVLKSTDGGNKWMVIREGSYGSRNISKVFFVNSEQGFLLGDGMEEFFKTTDSGKTWTKLQMDLNFQGVTSIYFSSADTGYATLWSNGILKTIDGGLSWRTIFLPQMGPFNAVDFPNQHTAFIVGMLGEILKTSDAGENWQIQNNSSVVLTNSNLESVDFIDEFSGFVVGGKDILKTSDGGKNWKISAQSTFDLHAVSFIDSLHGICVGGDWLHDFACISTTSDGGRTWNERLSSITDRYINKVRFINADTGYAVGGNTDTFGGFILKSTNAGNSWYAINTGIDNYWISDLSLPDEKTIYLVGQFGQILKSNDAGATWQKQNTNTTETLNAVFFLNSTTGYVVGDNQIILKTTNGGDSWIKQLSPKTQHLYSAYFKDFNTGYIASYDWSLDSCTVLLTTTDGGSNWHKKSIGKVRYPRKIVFVSKDTAFIAGDFGGILKSTDGGKNWKDSFQHGNSYFDMFFTNENTGYVIGEDGEISMTENCGNDWTMVDSSTDKDLRSICFTDINTGFAVGSGGIILKTTNSGSSLKAIKQPLYNLCPGDSVLLKPNFIGGRKPLSFDWDKLGTSSTLMASPENTTKYLVTITDQDMDTIQINLRVDVNYLPTPVITQHGDTLISNIEYGNNWYRNDTLISEINSNIFISRMSGDFYSIVYDNGCYSEKSKVIRLVTNISDNFCDDGIILYPNPVTSMLTLEFPSNYHHVELALFDDKGKLIREQPIFGEKAQLNISDLKYGIYFIKIIFNDWVTTKKIIKN